MYDNNVCRPALARPGLLHIHHLLSSAYVIAILRMPGAACQTAPRDILLAPRTWTQPDSYGACVSVLVSGKQG